MKKRVALLCTNRLDFKRFIEDTENIISHSIPLMTVETEDTIYQVIISPPRGEIFDDMQIISVSPIPRWELIQAVKRCIRKYQP